MIEIDLTAAAFELVRDGVTAKSRKSGVYKVLMPKNLAAKLDAARVSGEDMSDVILRLAREAEALASPHPLALNVSSAAPRVSNARFRSASVIGRPDNERHLSGS